MHYIFFCLLIAFVITITLKIKLSDRNSINSKVDFLDRETASNSTRKQSLDDLDYITIPLDKLPLCKSDDKSFELYQKIEQLSKCKIVNLTGTSNTDLKLSYGAANLEVLSEYDRNFTELSRTLYLWGKNLYEENNFSDSRKILEFAVSCKSDVSGIYTILAEIYKKNGNTELIENLITAVNELDSLMKNSIIKKLEDIKNNSSL